MTDNFYLALAAILLIPVIPAFILYKFLPASDTDVSGPYKGLSLKLKGAFAGYFLLVIVGVTLQYFVMGNQQNKQIEKLQRETAQKDSAIARLQTQLQKATIPAVNWQIKGKLLNQAQKNIRVWFDTRTVTQNDNGVFEMSKTAAINASEPPYWINFYNEDLGFKQINLDTEFDNPDITDYNILFDTLQHLITIKKPVTIDSRKKADTAAVANYLDEHPELKTTVATIDPVLIQRADTVKKQLQKDRLKYLNLQKLELEKEKKLMFPIRRVQI